MTKAEKRKEAQRKYRQTEKGKEAVKRANKKYFKTEKGREGSK